MTPPAPNIRLRTMKEAVEQAHPLKPESREHPPPPPPLPGWIVSTARWARFHLAATAHRVWSRRGAPSVIFGAALVATALLIVPGSTWTLSIFGLGAALIAIGLLGSRLRIVLGMKWQPEGLNVNFDLGVDARAERPPAAAPGAGSRPGLILPASAAAESAPPSVAEEIEVLEGVAETIEFSSAEVERKLAESKARGQGSAGAA